MKSYSTFEHTADLGLAASADTLAELFEAMAENLADQICRIETVKPAGQIGVEVQAEDTEALLVDFLCEVKRVLQVEQFMICSVEVSQVGNGSIVAELIGEQYDPARHELDIEIKAITYHQLRIARKGDGFVARVIVDV